MKPSLIRVFAASSFLVTLFIAVMFRFSVMQTPHPRFWRFVRVAAPIIAAGIGVNGLIFLIFARRQRRTVVQVLSALRGGDLRARFPDRAPDELGQLYQHFNAMADEVERLVLKLREAETAKANLLRELAHDVRTPLTSMRFIVETLHDRSDEISPSEIQESSAMVLSEMAYFQRLIEDLFLLAQISDPVYSVEKTSVDLSTLVKEECEKVEASGKFPGIAFERIGAATPLQGDGQMLRRMVRNLLENAAGFAKSRVTIRIESSDNGLQFLVRDDGPGFSAEAAAAYGQRRRTRLLDAAHNGRVSLGLGTVIVAQVVSAHRGTLRAGNWLRPDGQVGGAEVAVALPRPALALAA